MQATAGDLRVALIDGEASPAAPDPKRSAAETSMTLVIRVMGGQARADESRKRSP